MAVPQDLEEYGATRPAQPARSSSSRGMRVAAVGGAIVVTMLLAVAFLAGDYSERPVEEMIVTPDQKLQQIATSLALHGDTLSLSEMESKLESWRHDPATLLNMPEDNRMQMLASVSFSTSSLADDSTLCAKKDIIISKFDQLLKKLGGEELALNISNGQINSEYKEALQTWLDSESDFRLTAQRAKEAEDGASYAREQYEKYNTAYKDAKKTLDTINTQNTEERSGLLDERELIKEIMNMIGILQSGSAAPAASKRAMSSAQLQAKIHALEAIELKTKQPKMGQMLKQLKTSLAQFAEAEEVAAILKQMLQDIEDRLRIIDSVAASAQKTTDTMQASLIEWQTKLVDLSNARDKAKAQEQAQQLQREALAGQKKSAGETATQENAAYKLLITPYMKEIYVIQMIKTKIIDHCKAVAGA